MILLFLHQLLALDLNNGHQVSIPMLRSLSSKKQEILPASNSGIHSIAINPSRTLLATGAENPNNIGVYRLPTFDPICVGQVRKFSDIFNCQVSPDNRYTCMSWKFN